MCRLARALIASATEAYEARKVVEPAKAGRAPAATPSARYSRRQKRWGRAACTADPPASTLIRRVKT